MLDIDHVVDVEMMMVQAVVVVVDKDQVVVDIVYLMLVMIDHVVVELVDKMVQLDD